MYFIYVTKFMSIKTLLIILLELILNQLKNNNNNKTHVQSFIFD